METIKRLTDLDPNDLPMVERLFGQRIESTSGFVIILKSEDTASSNETPAASQGRLPDWCNVLEGMSDEDLLELDAVVNQPVRLARSRKNGS